MIKKSLLNTSIILASLLFATSSYADYGRGDDILGSEVASDSKTGDTLGYDKYKSIPKYKEGLILTKTSFELFNNSYTKYRNKANDKYNKMKKEERNSIPGETKESKIKNLANKLYENDNRIVFDFNRVGKFEGKGALDYYGIYFSLETEGINLMDVVSVRISNPRGGVENVIEGHIRYRDLNDDEKIIKPLWQIFSKESDIRLDHNDWLFHSSLEKLRFGAGSYIGKLKLEAEAFDLNGNLVKVEKVFTDDFIL